MHRALVADVVVAVEVEVVAMANLGIGVRLGSLVAALVE